MVGKRTAAFACAFLLFGVARAESFAASPTLALQIALDRRGFSCSVVDGAWGRKSEVALATWCALKGIEVPARASTRPGAAAAMARLFPDEPPLFKTVEVTAADVAALVRIPPDAAGKAALPAMGYETLQEAFAERGRLSQTALKRLNPLLAWPNPPIGSRVTIPDFESSGQDARRGLRSNVPKAASLRVSLSRFEITAFDDKGNLLALFPCSIAADKNKLPPPGEIQVKSIVPNPNYTYTPDHVPAGTRAQRHVFPPGPNNPVGVAWVGLTLPGYGIHGTPKPESIGRPESHGCFRLANWNARRLLTLCDVGVSVVVEE